MIIGGKAASLAKLRDKNFLVPPFIVCDFTWSEEKITEEMHEILPGNKYFAVRSSAENEDSISKSYAGQYYSAMGVKANNVFLEIKKVINSYSGASGSVIVQEFIPSTIAGVVFTDVNESIIINSTIGLCRPVVDGEDVDEYICNFNGTIISKNIPPNKTIQVFNKGKIVTKITSKESLDSVLIERLIKLSKNIKKHYKNPQDIEWCFFNDKFYILQSRPITRRFDIQEKIHYDSANISESYAGIVLPLTCTFAKMVYSKVYWDLLKMSGVSSSALLTNKKIFDNLLGFFYGRMYYNMNNWYLLAAFLPGYKRNKANFELMITSNINEEIATSIKPSLYLKLAYPWILVVKVLLFRFTMKKFMVSTKKELRRIRNRNLNELTYEKSIQLFKNINKKLLYRWYIPVENDFMVMTYLGLLEKLIGKSNVQKSIMFPSKATEQVSSLASISQLMSKNKTLWNAVTSNDAASFNKELKKAPPLAAKLTFYLETFGGRFANELKLESIGADEDTSKLLTLLAIYKDYKRKVEHSPYKIALPFYKKLLFIFLLRNFKKHASHREEFRLLRSNTFGMARRLFRGMGEILFQEGVIENSDDIFYLNINEVMNTTSVKNKKLKKLIMQRKEEYGSYKQSTPPTHFTSNNGQVPLMGRAKKGDVKDISAKPASPGVVRGKIKIFKEFEMPNNIDFDILVTSHTDPGWTSLLALCKGLIIEHGGVLSHASIVARELGIPTVIGATNAVNSLKDGQIVEINGSTGNIKVLNK